MMRLRSVASAALLALALDARASLCQPGARVEGQLIKETDSTYRVIIGNDTLFAITNSMRKAHIQAIRELRTMRQLADVDSTVIDAHAKVAQTCMTVHTIDLALIDQQRAQIKDHESLAKALESKISPWLSYEWGVGGNKSGPAVVGGIGIKKLRVWGTFQERGSAVFAGVYAPVH